MEVLSMGSNGSLVSADKTRDKSQGGVKTLAVGKILSAPLMNLEIQGSEAKDLLKKELSADMCTFKVAGLKPLSNFFLYIFDILQDSGAIREAPQNSWKVFHTL